MSGRVQCRTKNGGAQATVEDIIFIALSLGLCLPRFRNECIPDGIISVRLNFVSEYYSYQRSGHGHGHGHGHGAPESPRKAPALYKHI